MRFSEVESRRAYRSIVDQIHDAILRGDLREGDWLPSERDIAVQTGLSRSSVREALKVLHDAGLIIMKVGSGGGAQIVNDSIPTELLDKAIEMSHQRLLNLFEVRNILEISAAQLAAARATSAHIQEMERLLGEMENLVRERPEDKVGYTKIDVDFHQVIMKSTGNEVLVDTYTSILRDILPVMDMADLTEMESYGLPTMRDLVNAIKRRDPLAAQMAMYVHVYPLFELVERYFDS